MALTGKNELVKINDYLEINAQEENQTIMQDMGLEITAQNVKETKFIRLTETTGLLAYLTQSKEANKCYLYLSTIKIQPNEAKIVETKQIAYYADSIYFCVGMVNMDGSHIAIFCDDNLTTCTVNGTTITGIKSLGNPWPSYRSTEFRVAKITSTQILACCIDYADSDYKRKAVVITLTSDYQSFSKGSTIYTITEGNNNLGLLIKADDTHYNISYINGNEIKMKYLKVDGTNVSGVSAAGGASPIVAYTNMGNGKCMLLRQNGSLSQAVLNGDNYQYISEVRVSEKITSMTTTEEAIYYNGDGAFTCVFYATVESERGLYCCTFHIVDNQIIIDREATKIADCISLNFVFNQGDYFILGESRKLYHVIFKGLPGRLKCLGIVQKVEDGIASIATKGASKVNIKRETAYKVSGLGTYLTEDVIEIDNVNSRWLKTT